jgi:hypothetical protein
MLAGACLLHLANLCLRGQQSALMFRTNGPQSFVPKFQLMKLLLHAFLLVASPSRSGDENIEEERTKRALDDSRASFPLPLLLGNAELIH